MRVSVKTRQQQTPWPALRDVWQEADRIEAFDAGWVFDHFYPVFADADAPVLEGWTLLAALSQQTRRIRLGVMVSGNTYRHPAVLANAAATLDVVSGGRLELGLGAGWNEQEHAAYGIDLPPLTERFDRLEEACAVLDGLLTRPEVDLDGRYYRLRAARCEPKPVQRPRPPLVIGGRGERRTLRIAARWADQWNYPSGPVEDFRRKVDVLHAHCEEIGRDPAAIEVSVQVDAGADHARTAAGAAAYVDAGAQHVVLNLPLDASPALLGPLAEAVAPLFSRRSAGRVGEAT